MSVCLQQHARSRPAASGRLLDRPLGHDLVQPAGRREVASMTREALKLEGHVGEPAIGGLAEPLQGGHAPGLGRFGHLTDRLRGMLRAQARSAARFSSDCLSGKTKMVL